MDPYGPIAARFPLVARIRPGCSPLPDRVRGIAELAQKAKRQADQGLASAVFNQSALLASDLGLPDLARTMCHRHASAYLDACPLPATSAIHALEPLVNMARLEIRARRPDEGRHQLLALYEAVGSGTKMNSDDISVPADFTRTDDARQEVRAWLWRVLLADGTRSLTSNGRWAEALAHIQQHRGVGARMLDGRQVAVLAALTASDTDQATELLSKTAPGELWEQAVTDCLTVFCRREAQENVHHHVTSLVNTYLNYEGQVGTTVFDVRLGLAVLDAIGSTDHPGTHAVIDRLFRRTAEACDGYAAREITAHTLLTALAPAHQVQSCRDLVRACALGQAVLPDALHRDLSAGLRISATVIARSLRADAR